MQTQAVPARLHAGVVPPHALAQQRPRTQLPVAHWLFAVHVEPLAYLEVQVPALHQRVEPHVESSGHGPHVAPLQAPFGQVIGVCRQLPPPLQVPTGVATPLVHEAAPQVVLDVGKTQVADVPLQVPAHSPLPGQAARDGLLPVSGAPMRRRQVPIEPLSLHESHC